MKIETRRIGAFLKDSGNCRAVLLYGEDVGLIRERAESLVRFAAGSLDDPFRVTELSRDSIADLPGAAAAQALTGGRCAVRVRDVTDAATPYVKAMLEGRGDALVVLEGATLAARSKLRTLLEAAPDGAAANRTRKARAKRTSAILWTPQTVSAGSAARCRGGASCASPRVVQNMARSSPQPAQT